MNIAAAPVMLPAPPGAGPAAEADLRWDNGLEAGPADAPTLLSLIRSWVGRLLASRETLG